MTFCNENADNQNVVNLGNDITQRQKVSDLFTFYKAHSTELNDSQIAVFKPVIKKAVDSKDMKVHENVEDLDFESITGYQFDKTAKNTQSGLETYYFTIPFKNTGSSQESISSLMVGFDSNLDMQHYTEIQIEESLRKTKSTVYVDGEKVGSVAVPTQTEANEGQFHTQGYIDRVNACLEYYGITPATASLIVSTCGLACTISLGILCLPCLGVFGAIGGGVIVGCFINPGYH